MTPFLHLQFERFEASFTQLQLWFRFIFLIVSFSATVSIVDGFVIGLTQRSLDADDTVLLKVAATCLLRLVGDIILA